MKSRKKEWVSAHPCFQTSCYYKDTHYSGFIFVLQVYFPQNYEAEKYLENSLVLCFEALNSKKIKIIRRIMAADTETPTLT